MSVMISKYRPIWILVIGFSFVILLLMLLAWFGFRQAESPRQRAAQLVSEHLATTRLADEIEHEVQRAGSLMLGATRGKSGVNSRRHLQDDLSIFESRMPELIKQGRQALPDFEWQSLDDAARRYGMAVREMLDVAQPSEAAIQGLEAEYDRFLHLTSNVVRQDTVRSASIEDRIEQELRALTDGAGWLLAGCLLFAIASAIVTIRFTLNALKRIEWQAQELNRVSWHLIEGQEEAARRFSHELHDELGQSLAGLKATMVNLQPADLEKRRGDCLQLLDESISNVRELSQLLRPLILDDFGLDAALRWLLDRFEQRTKIQVEFHSRFGGRFPDEIETHLFRITQEALTNVVRHSGATRVQVDLRYEAEEVSLSILDNGTGFQSTQIPMTNRGLGLVGMRARAEQIAGNFTLKNEHGGGVRVEVRAPARLLEEGKHGTDSYENSARG